jgi:hypothetical protein
LDLEFDPETAFDRLKKYARSILIAPDSAIEKAFAKEKVKRRFGTKIVEIALNFKKIAFPFVRPMTVG